MEHSRYYDIHGVVISVASRCEDSLDSVYTSLGYFGHKVIEGDKVDASFKIEVEERDFRPVEEVSGELIGSMPELGIEYRELDPGVVYISYPGTGEAILDFSSRTYTLTVAAPIRPWEVGFTLIQPLRFLLSRYRLLMAHGAALSSGGRSLLITGWSGSGKSTATAILMRSGYSCFSDDHALLRYHEGCVVAKAFPEPFGVTDNTQDILMGLGGYGLERESYTDPGGKKYFPLASFGQVAEQAAPIQLVVFPRVMPNSRTHLRPLSKAAALNRLLTANGMLLHRESMRWEFGLWCRLVDQAQPLELISGKGLEDLPRVIDAFLS